MFVVIIKSQEKIMNFNLNSQNLAGFKIPDIYVNFKNMLNLHRVLLCTVMDFDDIMHIACLS